MTDPLTALQTWVEPMLQKLDSRARINLAMQLGREQRRSIDRRVSAQQNPDGTPFAPRKAIRDQVGRIRRDSRGRMFRRITKSEYLKLDATANGVTIGFIGRVARIAQAHQHGLVDTVRDGGPAVRYPRRELLGFTAEDIERHRDTLIRYFGSM